MTWKQKKTVNLCLISACHFHEHSGIIKWKYLASIKLRSFFVVCSRKWAPEEKRPLLDWLMYCVFQSVSWKICIFPFDFTHQLQEVHCSNENHSTTFMLSLKCLSLTWFKCLIPVFQISTVITHRYIILMHNRFQDNQIWVLKTHRPFSVYTYMHTTCLMTAKLVYDHT